MQEEFFNAVIKIKTLFEPKDLFHLLKSVERQVGRKIAAKWGPREIDLDILFFNDLVFSDEEITIPHKDLLNRDFVLIPLNEIAPDLIHPALNKKISEISIFQSEADQPDKLGLAGEPSAQTRKSYIIRKIPHRVLVK